MNALENIERTLEEWGQQLRGGTSTHGLQPRDVLRAVLTSLEANRVEGLDHKMYAPNAYTVYLNLDDEERSRLMPFLGHEELEAAIERYCGERKYQFRGALGLQVVEGPLTSDLTSPDEQHTSRSAEAKKIDVQSRFDVSQMDSQTYDSELARQFVTPTDSVRTLSNSESVRSDPPTYAGQG